MHVHDKATRVKNATGIVKERFNLIDSELVIQEYHVTKGLSAGKLYVTQNYCGFVPSVLGEDVLVPFFKTKEISWEKGILGVGASVSITMEDFSSPIVFRSLFGTRLEEVYNLLLYLKDFPPMYVEEDEDHSSVSNSTSTESNSNPPNFIAPMFPKQERNDLLESSGGSSLASKVDNKTTKEALRHLYEAKNVGSSSLQTLQNQGEQLDRIEHNLDRVDHNLATSEKLVKGMSGVNGFFGLGGGEEDTSLPGKKHINRKIEVKKEEKPVDLEILHKLQNCSLEKAQLRFTSDRFMLLKSKKPVASTIKEYGQVAAIVIRTRPQHIDIRLKDQTRIRILTSYPQRVVAEFVARMDPSVHVAFEQDARVFSYGASIREAKPASRGVSFKRANQSETNSTSSSVSGSFAAPLSNSSASNSNSNNYVSNSSQQSSGKTVDNTRLFRDQAVKQAVKEQEDDLDEMSRILDDLGAIAGAIGGELDRQNEHLDYLNDRVDNSNSKQVELNRKLNKML